MTKFSRRQMLREYQGDLNAVKPLLIACFALAVIFFWILYIGREDHSASAVWLYAALPTAVGALIMGWYLVMTGDDWLIRHTPYGKALTKLGNAGEIMADIDREALSGDMLSCGAFLSHWLVLYYASPCKRAPGRVCARPIPVKKINRAAFRRERSGAVFTLSGQNGETLGSGQVDDQEEWKTVLQWMRAQEIELLWLN